MCFKTPKAPAVRAAPQRDTNAALVQDARRAATSQNGVFANLATGPLGDSTYGTNTQKLAKLGARG